MEKEFVPYELALKLKELGFDEECLGKYHIPAGEESINIFGKEAFLVIKGDYFNSKCKIINAPLWQQAFDFMAFKCSIHGNVITSGTDKIYMSSEYREGYGGTKSNNGTYTDIYQCRIDLLEDMIELFKRPKDY